MEKHLLHNAVLESDIDAVRQLINSGVNLNELNEVGLSPLHCAVFGGYDDIVRILLEAGADPNVFSDDGVTPKWRARDFGLTEIENILGSFGGHILTNEYFDRTAFTIFNDAIGLPLPEEDTDDVNEKE